MRIGLFGFPKTGKTTLFGLLTGATAPSHASRGEAQIGVAKVSDARLDRLVALYQPRKVTPTTVEYIDLVGVKKGEAAEALPLDQLRTVDALAHVVRAFRDDSIPHVEGSLDPARDVATMETEFLIADHTLLERRIEKLDLSVKKAHRDEDRKELEMLRRCLGSIEREVPLRNLEFAEDEEKRLRGFTFLTRKPLLVVVNADEADAGKLAAGPPAFGIEGLETRPGCEAVVLSARIEAEIAQLDLATASAFRDEIGIPEPALDRIIRASHHLLGNLCFFTVSEDECRAWTIRRGLSARAAAGTVHSDMERGFIRAETVAFDDLVAAGSWTACRDRGTLRAEGRDYVVRDGDVILFRFNV